MRPNNELDRIAWYQLGIRKRKMGLLCALTKTVWQGEAGTWFEAIKYSRLSPGILPPPLSPVLFACIAYYTVGQAMLCGFGPVVMAEEKASYHMPRLTYAAVQLTWTLITPCLRQ